MRLKRFITEEKETYEFNTRGGGKLKSSVPPPRRSYKNIPKYANGKNKVAFQDWLMIKGEGGGKNPDGSTRPHFFGKSEANGKWYGWSHRAIASFGIGDEVKGDNLGKKRPSDKDFTIKTEKQARDTAYTYARSVA